jgi:hypothetical protein
MAGVITATIGQFTATFDGTAVHIYGEHGELLDTLLATVTTEAELVGLLPEWLRQS